jgi:hypothetical protein
MNFMGFLRKRPARQPRARRRATSAWLRQITKSDSAKKLVEDLTENNPTLQAVIVRHLTGIEIDPDDIRIPSPQEKFERVIINEVIKEVSQDREFMEEAKRIVMDNLYLSISQKWGTHQGDRVSRFGPDGTPIDPGYMRGMYLDDLLAALDAVTQIRAHLKGDSVVETLLKSPAVAEIIKTITSVLLSRLSSEQLVEIPPSAAFIDVEVDGELVAMTRAGYEVYKKLKEQLANMDDSPDPNAATISQGDAADGASPSTPADSQALSAAFAQSNGDGSSPSAPSAASAASGTDGRPNESGEGVSAADPEAK